MYDITDVEDFTKYLYSRLPQIYRSEDAKVLYTSKDGTKGGFLYKYLESLVKGGYNKVINSQYTKEGKLEYLGINDILLLLDSIRCPDEVFPYLYNCFGLNYFPDIDIKYQRKFLQNIGFMNSMKGTLEEAQFIANVLTGMENKAECKREENGDRILYITMFAETLEQIQNVKTECPVVERFLRTRIPFYLVPHAEVEITGNLIKQEMEIAQKIVISKGYTLKEKEVL